MANSHLSPTTGDFTIDAAARRELLRGHNELRAAVTYAEEMKDLNLSHLSQMEDLVHKLYSILKFAPGVDDDGRPQFWGNWVLAEENEPAPKKRGRPKKNDG
jgi:hypothetical protein